MRIPSPLDFPSGMETNNPKMPGPTPVDEYGLLHDRVVNHITEPSQQDRKP